MTLRSPSRNALVIALLIFGASPACVAAAEPFPAATPESQGMSSQSLAKLLDVVRGFADKGEIVGGELLVALRPIRWRRSKRVCGLKRIRSSSSRRDDQNSS